jgi:hypothetical protein
MRTGSVGYRIRSVWRWWDLHLEEVVAVMIPALVLVWTWLELGGR